MYRLLPIFLLFLAGCTSLVPGTALRLQGVDPLSADPGEISVAVELPEGLGVLPDSVKLGLAAQNADGRTIADSWTLETLRQPGDRWVFRVAEADRAEMRRLQATARAWEEADPKGTSGSISVTLGGCRTDADADLSDARASVLIGFAADEPERPLFRNAPISEVLSDTELSLLPPCP